MRAALLVALGLLAVGCSRAHYRRQADGESYEAIAERNQCPAWALPRIDITPAANARIADPYNPDRPPMPPDDPFAHRYMHCVDGMHGWRHWHDDGDAPSVEPPGWRDGLPLDADNALAMTPDSAVEVALTNSREYQRAIEDVYLLALALTLNRFEFDCHWFGRNTSTLTQFGSSATEHNTFGTASDLGFARNFAAGGQLLVDFANSVVVNFRGGATTVNSNILVQLAQPLLRNAGRQVRLESLTQAERDLLYAVRDFARFRKDFYADLTTRGNGYLGLLLELQNIRNFETNIASQEQNLRLHEALFAGGIVSTVQVDQVFQSYQQARFTLLLAQVTYNNDLDNYKIRLGLPPDIAIKLDDSQLNPFQLSSPELTRDQTDMDKLLAGLRERDQPPSIAELREGLERMAEFVRRANGYTSQIEGELGRWRLRLDDPKTAIDTASREREQTLYRTLLRQIAVIQDGLRELGAQLNRAAAGLSEKSRTEDWRAVLRLARLLIARLGELFVVQTQIRVFLIDVPEVQYQEGPAIETALACRLDLMNLRGRVVDSWRKIAVAANGLEAGLNLILTAQPATEPGSHNPFDFSSKASQYSAAVQFDAPLNRVAERNIYRASLVSYQRARRDFMAAEDQVRLSVRRDLRQLTADRQGFAIARLTLLAAARQLEGARESLLLAEKGSDSTTSTLNILNALDGLLQARNALIGRYVSYETNRLQLLLDLEALQLDERGLPIHDCTTLADERERSGAGPRAPDIADLLPPGNLSPSRERLNAVIRSSRRPEPRRRGLPILAGVAVLGVAGWFGVQHWWPKADGAAVPVTGTVTRGVMPITVTERGEIESSITTDAICEVEGREIKLVSIVPEGTRVTKGQEVCKFDPEKLNRTFAEQEIKWKQAIGKAGAAKGELEVQINKAESEIAKAKLDLTLAQLEKDKYLLGEYQVELFKIKGAIELAEKDYQEAKDKLAFYQQFEKKGFGTPEQTRVRELMVGQYEFQLRMNQIALTVLEKFTRKQKETELTAKAEDAGRQLKRTEKSTKGAVDKAQSDLEAAEITAKLEKQELDRIKIQLDRCVIKAPQDGILVYSKDRYWDSSSRIQSGAMVYFRQTIFTIPDLTKMQVKVKVHESVVKKIHPDLKADIVMDALPGQTLHGTVIAVGTMAHQEGFWNQGAKEYLTTIRVDDLPETAGMKPGMTGEVNILVNRLSDVLMAPVQAVTESEGRHLAFVVGRGGIEIRTVVVGENNDKFVQIKEGLAEGERIALDARTRIAAQAKSAENGAPAK